MVIDDNEYSIHTALKKLIEEKSRRDNIKFTACQLAQALNMPRSIITKLTHPDKNKRVTNPKLDTIVKIVKFFKDDGFNITIEDLLESTVSIKNQPINPMKNQSVSIPIYSLNKRSKMGMIDVKLSAKCGTAIALYADKDIKPFFKSGSIFIVDKTIILEDGYLIAIKLEKNDDILIKKYRVHKKKIILESLDETEKDIQLMPTEQVMVLGVVVQVNANT